MANDPIKIEYRQGLDDLEKALGAVSRPGAFAALGRAEIPLPKLVVQGVGQISFPVSSGQARKLIGAALQAPYGRGTETVVDTSVRKVWQLGAEAVQLGGKGWEGAVAAMLGGICEGLGCGEANVSAELYKLLVYEKGGFFLSHRDTEKAPGMFGTLVVALPSAHEGGDLVIRHGGVERVVSLAGEEPSEVAWAAFYADCEHEVKPVTKGYRVCLVYNLIQQGKPGRAGKGLAAPDVSGPARQVAGLLRQAFAGPTAPVKLAWLLEHQYSPAELSFATLKNADAARAAVMLAAAPLAECEAHLGIVHIEESGGAEMEYDAYSSRYGRGRSRWRERYDDDDEEESSKKAGDSGAQYEIMDVCDTNEFIDHWIAQEDARPAYGQVPLGAGELLPDGALDGEPPDKDRVTEATGNEGATYERSYHRAVLVVWPSDRIAEVLLQAGPEAVVPHLRKCVEALTKSRSPRVSQEYQKATALARRMVSQWVPQVWREWRHETSDDSRKTNRAVMLQALNRLGDHGLVSAFIEVIAQSYDGTENEALKESALLMGNAAVYGVMILVRQQLPKRPKEIVGLVTLLAGAAPAGGADYAGAVISAICEGLPNLTVPKNPHAWVSADTSYGGSTYAQDRLTPGLLAELIRAMEGLGNAAAAEKFVPVLKANPVIFDPLLILAPALEELLKASRGGEAGFFSARPIWKHTAEKLLERSHAPPGPPEDWSLTMQLACSCADCRELHAFSIHPEERTHRFRLNKDRRMHLHRKIEAHGLDMTHITERKGSPQTLVCQKTRRRFELRAAQYQADLAACAVLVKLAAAAGTHEPGLLKQLKSVGRTPTSS